MQESNRGLIPSGAMENESGFEGSFRGLDYTVVVTLIDGRVELVIEMKREFPLQIDIRREDTDRLFHGMGFPKKISTGDERFDRDFSLTASDPSLALAFMDSRRMDAVVSLFDRWPGLSYLSYGHSHMMLTLTDMEYPDSSAVESILDAAADACYKPGLLPQEKGDWPAFSGLVFTIILFLAGGILLLASPSDAILMGSYRGRMYLWLCISMAVYVPVTMSILRGKTNPGARLVFMSVFAAVGFLMLYSAVFNTLNVRLDKTLPLQERAMVEDAFTSRTGKSAMRVLVVVPEGSPRSYSVVTGGDIYRTVQRGDEVVLYIRPGRFGIPWFSLYGN